MKLSEAELRRKLTTRWLGRGALMFFETLDSTNDEAQRRIKELGHGSLVVADAQSAGKGRRGRRWQSPAGCNLYVSVVVRQGLAAHRGGEGSPLSAGCFSLAVALGLSDWLTELGAARDRVVLKWPNDVLLDGSKVSGVLIEGVYADSAPGSPPAEVGLVAAIVGVGVNVHQEDFPEDLGQPATSLRLAGLTDRQAGPDATRIDLLAQLLASLEPWIERGLEGQHAPIIHEARRRAQSWLGQRVTITEYGKKPRQALALDIAEDGALEVRFDDGQQCALYAADVSLGLTV